LHYSRSSKPAAVNSRTRYATLQPTEEQLEEHEATLRRKGKPIELKKRKEHEEEHSIILNME